MVSVRPVRNGCEDCPRGGAKGISPPARMAGGRCRAGTDSVLDLAAVGLSTTRDRPHRIRLKHARANTGIGEVSCSPLDSPDVHFSMSGNVT